MSDPTRPGETVVEPIPTPEPPPAEEDVPEPGDVEPVGEDDETEETAADE